MVRKVKAAFSHQFGGEPQLFRSPGRVNLIGEHTDYNEGFVLPGAVDKAIVFAIAPRRDAECRTYAADLEEAHRCTTNALEKSDKRWPNYLMGVVDQLQKAGFEVGGFDCAFGGNIPIGAGMSSSAAIEAGLAYALNELFHLGIDPLALVKLAQKAENEFVGVRCGIMDQFINIFGKEHRLVRLDCRSLEYVYVPFERVDIRIVLCDTQVKRELASSEYNVRRAQCEAGVHILRRYDSTLRSLRDVSLDLLDAHRGEMDPVVHKRCAYVLNENSRVLEACEHLSHGDVQSFGREMFASHDGLRGEYEVSSPELDVLVDAASRVRGVLGARMMGAGFGGCTINLVENSAVSEFSETVRGAYKRSMGKDAKVYVSSICAGTSRIEAEDEIPH